MNSADSRYTKSPTRLLALRRNSPTPCPLEPPLEAPRLNRLRVGERLPTLAEFQTPATQPPNPRMETTNEALLALARSTAAKSVALDARIDATMGFAAGLAMRAGMTETEAAEALQKCATMAYEKALLKLEDKDPGLAADLDLRWPSDFLKF